MQAKSLSHKYCTHTSYDVFGAYKKLLKPGTIRKIAKAIQKRFGLTQRKICRYLGISGTAIKYTEKEGDDEIVPSEMNEIIAEHPGYGCQILCLKLRQRRRINHKKVERIYRENRMQLKNRKGKKKYIVAKRTDHILSTKPDKWLAIDFVIDSVGNSKQLKMLTAIDPVTKEVPVIEAAFSMNSRQVIEQLDKIRLEYGPFTYLQTDNGPEFRSAEFEAWCSRNNVNHVFSRPGKPTDNCFIESFNRILRTECLDMYYFPNIQDARRIIENWRIDYNTNPPQKGLHDLTPMQFKDKLLDKKPNLNFGLI